METDFPIKRTRKAKTRLPKLASRLGLVIVAVALVTLKGALAQAVSSGASPAATQSPIIGGRIDIWTDGLDNYEPAVAYNSNHDEYLVVWWTWQDAYTHDIWARRVDGDGTLLSSFNVATAPGEKREEPAVAYNAVRDEYLVVYTHQYNSTTSDILAKRVAWDGSWMSSEIAIMQAPDWHLQPTVAYNSIDDEYLVVYVNHWGDGLVDIYAQRVRGSDGALLSWSAVASGTEAYRGQPSVAYSTAASGGNGGYLIAYWYHHTTTSAQEIRAKVTQADLADLWTNPEITLRTSGNYLMWSPVVASGQEGYLAAWWEERHVDYQVRGRRVGSDGTPLGGADGFGIGEESNSVVINRMALAYGEGYGYMATWAYYNNASMSIDIHGRYVMDGQDSASGSPFVVEGGESGYPSVACAPSGDCLVAYIWWNVSDYDIGGRFVRPHRVYLPLVVRDF